MTATCRRILITIGRYVAAGFLDGLRFAVGIVIGFVLGLAAVWTLMAHFVDISLALSKLVIFLLRLFLSFFL